MNYIVHILALMIPHLLGAQALALLLLEQLIGGYLLHLQNHLAGEIAGI